MRVYLDLYFILNFMMNLFLFLFTGMVRQKHLATSRLLGASFLGACVATGAYAGRFYVGDGVYLVEFLFLPVQLRLAYGVSGTGVGRWDFLWLLGISVFTGGFLTVLYQPVSRLADRYPHTGSYTLGFLGIGLFLLAVTFFLLRHILQVEIKRMQYIQAARLTHGGTVYPLRILVDSGNALRSPYSGEPVAVIGKTLACKLQLENNPDIPPLYIPYRSVGGCGLLPAYRLDDLTYGADGCLHHFLAAVSHALDETEIQMIIGVDTSPYHHGHRITEMEEDYAEDISDQ